MKINLSYPATGCQKLIEIADELKVPDHHPYHRYSDHCHPDANHLIVILSSTCYLAFQVRPFYEKRMGQEVEADTLGDEFKVGARWLGREVWDHGW